VLLEGVAQVAQAPDAPNDSELIALDHGDSRRIVSTVLKTGQTTDQDVGGATRPDVSDDSTHMLDLRVVSGVRVGTPLGG